MGEPEIKSFIIRPMQPEDIGQALDLSMTEGWNQTLKDWSVLLYNSDNVCLVAEKDHRIVGTATALNHGNMIAWIGMVIVDKSVRGQGVGKMLLESIIDKLKNIGSIKLDATPAGEVLYRKLGFIEEFKIFRMTCNDIIIKQKDFHEAGISGVDRESFPEVVKLDRIIFGADRSYLLENLLRDYPEKAFLIKYDGITQGFVFGRDGSRFNYVGPVIAWTEDSAKYLLSRVLGSLNNQNIALDVPEDKQGLISWLESVGFVKQRHFVRMYLKSNQWPGMIKNQFLISGPEYG